MLEYGKVWGFEAKIKVFGTRGEEVECLSALMRRLWVDRVAELLH